MNLCRIRLFGYRDNFTNFCHGIVRDIKPKENMFFLSKCQIMSHITLFY